MNTLSVQHDSLQNIRAGIGYLLQTAAHFGYKDVPIPVPDDPMRRYVPPVTTGGYFQGGWTPLKLPGPAKRRVYAITGWRIINLPFIAQHYNGGGDGNYLDKLNHAYSVILNGIPKEVTK